MQNRHGRKKRVTYPQLKKIDLNWRKEDLKFACCDCGLIHRMRFIVNGRQLRARFWRLNRNTGQYRRWNNIRVREINGV